MSINCVRKRALIVISLVASRLPRENNLNWACGQRLDAFSSKQAERSTLPERLIQLGLVLSVLRDGGSKIVVIL